MKRQGLRKKKKGNEVEPPTEGYERTNSRGMMRTCLKPPGEEGAKQKGKIVIATKNISKAWKKAMGGRRMGVSRLQVEERRRRGRRPRRWLEERQCKA